MSVYERDLPEGIVLDESVDRDVYFAEYYEHWTVRDVIRLLLDYDMDARVWIGPPEWPENGNVPLRPVEVITPMKGEVIL